MSPRWWAHLCVPALGVVLGAFPAAVANAQCSHGRQAGPSYPGLSQSLLQQQRLQQQLLQLQLLQQQQLLQEVQQQQHQKKVLEGEVRQLVGKGPEVLKTALQDPRPEKRWAAAFIIGKDRLPLTDELIERLTDDNPSVRQAARRGLVRLSTRTGTQEGKPVDRRSVDFGPALNASLTAQKAAAGKWRTWFQRQQARSDSSKVAAAPASPVALAKDRAAAPGGSTKAVPDAP